MSAHDGLAVSVLVEGPGGHTEHIRVGTAYRSGDGFVIQIDPVHIGASEALTARRSPPFALDLEYYADRARKKLADPTKARWHDAERATLQAIEAEQARRSAAKKGSPAEPSGAHP